MTNAVVVGSGPNGLAAATVLARAGVEVTVVEAADHLGGCARSVDSPVEGLLQDHCAAVHPMAPGSAYFQSLDLEAMGVEWGYAHYDAAHPLDGGDAGLLSTSIETTAAALGRDGGRWAAMFGPSARVFHKLSPGIMAPMLRVPRHLALLRDAVKQAQADWPALLRNAPPAVRTTVRERLAGAVRISQGTRPGTAGGG